MEFLNEFNGATGHRFGERQEILLMFYLQRSRFQDAVNLSQRLDAAGVGGEKARHTRKAIMSRYAHRLPPSFNRPNLSSMNRGGPLGSALFASMPGNFPCPTAIRATSVFVPAPAFHSGTATVAIFALFSYFFMAPLELIYTNVLAAILTPVLLFFEGRREQSRQLSF